MIDRDGKFFTVVRIIMLYYMDIVSIITIVMHNSLTYDDADAISVYNIITV